MGASAGLVIGSSCTYVVAKSSSQVVIYARSLSLLVALRYSDEEWIAHRYIQVQHTQFADNSHVLKLSCIRHLVNPEHPYQNIVHMYCFHWGFLGQLTSMKIPSMPTATAVRATVGINSRKPPLATPPPC